MGPEKNKITPQHISSINKAINLFGSQANMAKSINVVPSNISLWARGLQMIPLKHVDKICDMFPEVDPLELRPDIKKYEKYFR